MTTLLETQNKTLQAMKIRSINDQNLPIVIEPTDPKMSLSELLRSLREQRPLYKDLLLKSGGLLFRNFPVLSEQHFSEVIKGLGLGEYLDYIGGDSPRNKITEGIYTSTEAPPSIKIPLHNELSFVKNYPKHIYFYCHVAPKEKGETILGDARKIYQEIDPNVKARFIEKGLKYVSCYYYKSKWMSRLNRSHKTWIDVFETENKKEVERKCYEGEFNFKWNQNDWIQISQTRPATLTHPETDEKVWFNQMHLYDFNPRLLGWAYYCAVKLFYIRKHMRLHEVYYADGSIIPREHIYHIHDVLDANTIYFPWQKGDVLVLDNILAMHGRATFKGKRKIFAAMTG